MLFWPVIILGILGVAAAAARWGLRGGVLGWFAGLLAIFGFWVYAVVGPDPSGATWAFVLIVMFVVPAWAVVGACAVSLGIGLRLALLGDGKTTNPKTPPSE